MPQSPDIGQNPDGAISDFQISGQFFINENSHNSRTSYDIDMKLEPATKLGKRKTTMSKNFTTTLCWQIVTLFSFFRFMANLQPFGSQIVDV